jgi:hypothetical protein
VRVPHRVDCRHLHPPPLVPRITQLRTCVPLLPSTRNVLVPQLETLSTI